MPSSAVYYWAFAGAVGVLIVVYWYQTQKADDDQEAVDEETQDVLSNAENLQALWKQQRRFVNGVRTK